MRTNCDGREKTKMERVRCECVQANNCEVRQAHKTTSRKNIRLR